MRLAATECEPGDFYGETPIFGVDDGRRRCGKGFRLAHMDDFYKEYILDHYRNPRNFGHLEAPTAVAEDLNPLCGDTIRVEIHVDDAGRVDDVCFSGKGCAISRASTSMLLESVRGQTLEEVAHLSIESVVENVGIGISPARMKCATLGLKVLKSAALGHIATWPDEAAG